MDNQQISTKQALIVLGSLVLVLASTLVVPAKWVGIESKTYKKLNLNDLTPISSLSEDSDNNNSPDWRDLAVASLGTSTKKAMSEAKVDPELQKRLNDPNNLTSSFSKNMYIASSYLKQNSGSTADDQKNLINSIVQQEASKITVTEYTEGDINILKKETESDRKKYGNSLGLLMQKADTYKIGEGDVEIIKAYTVNKDASMLTSFVVKKDKLDTLIKSLTTMSVPYSAVPYHLLALNKISEYRTILDSFAKTDTDPVRSTISFNNYLPVANSLFIALNNMRGYFTAENVIFTKDESGYIFSPEYTIQ
jgi:hypothetical protein